MIYHGDCLEILRTLPDQSVHCCVTSPPYYGLRDYGVDGQIGLEPTPEAFVVKMVNVFREVRRVLRDDGTLFLNLGDSYAGGKMGRDDYGDEISGLNNAKQGFGKTGNIHSTPTKQRPVCDGSKPKDLLGIPWRVAFALQSDGWYLRQDIIWAKPNPMPESVRDRCTKSHEYIFLMSKSPRYYFDAKAIAEPCVESNAARPRMGQGPNTQYSQKRSWKGSDFHDGKNLEIHPTVGKKRESVKRGEFNGKTNAMPGREAFRAITETRNKRSVWTVSTQPFKAAHFATFPPKLIEPCILAGCPVGGVVLDPFFGAGTTGLVALQNSRQYIGIELNEKYIQIAQRRLAMVQPKLEGVA